MTEIGYALMILHAGIFALGVLMLVVSFDEVLGSKLTRVFALVAIVSSAVGFICGLKLAGLLA